VAVGEGSKWVKPLFSVGDPDRQMGLRFGLSLLETVNAVTAPNGPVGSG
jgi:hypothetical protein